MAEQMMQEAAGKTIPAGYKQTEVGVIPEDWGVSTLMEITIDMLQGINTAIDKPEYVYSGVPILKANNVIDQVVSLGNADQISLKSYLKYNQRYSVKRNDFLFSNIGARLGTGALWESDITATFAWNVMRIIPDARKVFPKFLAQLINSPKQSEKIQSEQSGSGMGFIPKATMQKLLLPLPRMEEQTAIANVLSDSDALIGALEQLIAKKQAIKSATMQQLLTGRTRLPAFALRPDGTPKGYKPSEQGDIPEDWEVNPLGALLKERPRYGINAPAVPLTGDTPVYIRITDISDDGYFNPSEKVGVSSPFSGMYFLSDGDIVLARTGASVGKSYLYNKNDGQLVYAGFLIKISPNQERLSSAFLSQYLKSHQYWNWVVVNSMRSGQPGINGSEYANLLIPTPTIEEQTAIATILSDMDNELQALTQKLEKARAIKQGMMQQLLTGKIRLPLEVGA